MEKRKLERFLLIGANLRKEGRLPPSLGDRADQGVAWEAWEELIHHLYPLFPTNCSTFFREHLQIRNETPFQSLVGPSAEVLSH